jgi:uncharacterized delta-60 repeat protein/prepilin-type N-terminal cleavage/methylation domain-containing protein
VPHKNQSGFSLIELVMVIVIIAVVATYVAVDLNDKPDSLRFEQTRAKLEAIRSAIVGDDSISAEGQRLHFGYFGDMGKIPATLTDLTTIGAQSAWAYSASLGFGVGWRGPYVSQGARISGSLDSLSINRDEWGTAFVYNTSEPIPTITSYGADRVSGGTGFSKDMVVEIPSNIRLSTLKGIARDSDTPLSGKTIQVDFATNGSVISSTTTSDASGAFTFQDIPFGVRAIRMADPNVGPLPIIVDRPSQILSDSILNPIRASKNITVVSSELAGSAALGYSNSTVFAYLRNNHPEERQLKSIAVSWYPTNASGAAAVGSARLVSYSLNGVKEAGFSPATNGLKISPTARQTIRRGNTTTAKIPLELNFDSNMKGIPLNVALEWVGSDKLDTISFTPTSPAWGTAGTLDTSFGTDGRTFFSGYQNETGGYNYLLPRVALQTDGKFVIAGTTSGLDFAVARYNPKGTLDTTFGGVGRVVTDLGSDAATGVAVDGAGKIVVVGKKTDYDFVIMRYTTGGPLDTTFGTAGSLQLSGISGNSIYVRPDVAIQSDGKILATHYYDAAAGNDVGFRVYRFTTNGNLDNTFGTSGIFRGIRFFYPYRAVLDTSGKLLLGGFINTSYGGAATQFAAARFQTDGSLDTTFGTSGVLLHDVTAGVDSAWDVAIQSDGKVLLGGNMLTANDKIAIARYGTNGIVDTSWGTSGVATYTSGTNYNVFALSVGAQGKVLAVSPWTSGAVWRYLSNGQLDTSFGTSGIANRGANYVPFGVVRAPTGQYCVSEWNDNGVKGVSITCLWP